MSELYRIHFGSSKSKYYPQAVRLAELAYEHEIYPDGEDSWHIVILTEEQLNLMGFLYEISKNLPWARQYDENGVDRYPLIEKDMSRVQEKLEVEGYIDYYGPGYTYVIATKTPEEPIPEYRYIRELISEGEFKQAVKTYYSTLGQAYYDELVEELIYLKRLANIPLTGRDLLYFRPPSSRKGLIEENLSDYVVCIDAILSDLEEKSRQLPLEIIIEYAPTLDQLIEKTKREWNQDKVTVENLDFKTCPKGRFFDRYPDQVLHCRVNEFRENWEKNSGLWTTYSPESYQEEILDQGRYLSDIEVCCHKLCNEWDHHRSWKKTDFTTITSKDEIRRKRETARRIKYTGRTHQVEGEIFYEIAIAWYEKIPTDEIENPFISLVDEILREAENLLRERHDLPRIGEGWISETKLYHLVRDMYPGAQQHASPDWLKPQHLDVFVPSENIAFEYQGRQHFEPVDFFGGKEAFKKTKKRDRRKGEKCKANEVRLIYWRYDEDIDLQTLVQKLNSEF